MRTRRSIAQQLVAAAAAAFAPSCASVPTTRRGQRPYLAPVNVSESRVIRIDVGLRPFRPSGFRVAREALGDKTIIHNYGHGGGGITLSWGSAKLALDLGHDPAQSDYAVLGCGAVGLATARLLQERGAKVRIYAKALPPNVTSNVAGAQFWPASVFEPARVEEGFLDRLVAAMAYSSRRFQSFAGEHYGVSWEANYFLSNRPIHDYPVREGGRLAPFAINLRDLSPSEHPFSSPHVRAFDTMMIETPNYLRAVEADFRAAGGEISVHDFSAPEEIAALPENVVFNCTGLGAGVLFGDSELEPVRGQLVILEPQPEVGYNLIADGLYMFGRRDGIVLGGSFEHGVWSLEPDPAVTARILGGHKRIFAAMARR